jgi:hypothetical protein
MFLQSSRLLSYGAFQLIISCAVRASARSASVGLRASRAATKSLTCDKSAVGRALSSAVRAFRRPDQLILFFALLGFHVPLSR